MNITGKKNYGIFNIEGISLGELLAICNGLGYGIQGGFGTPLQREVYDAIKFRLNSMGSGKLVEDVQEDPAFFLSERFGIS